MTWYADLSPYSYLPATLPEDAVVLNVGWLGPEHEFETGEPPERFAAALATMCANDSRATTRGWHVCELPHPDATEYPFEFTINGGSVPLGSAEVRVVAADGRWLAAPDLIYHYVQDHHYLPPPAFIDAVLAVRIAPPWPDE